MQAVLEHALPAALWQPIFTICLGRGQVKVLTLAFVGEPVAGDRPSCKRTPYMLKVLSDNLYQVGSQPVQSVANYSAHLVPEDVLTTERYLAQIEPKLFEAVDNGTQHKAWDSLLNVSPIRSCRTSASEARSRSALARGALNPDVDSAPRTSQHRHFSDRASRMRANFERAQSPASVNVAGARNSGIAAGARSADASPASQDTQTAFEGAKASQKTTVSVLADGLSVKSITSAWNSSVGGFLARARSPLGITKPAQHNGSGSLHSAVDRQSRMQASVAARTSIQVGRRTFRSNEQGPAEHQLQREMNLRMQVVRAT